MSFRYITICDQCLVEIPDWRNSLPDGWVCISTSPMEQSYNLCKECWQVASDALAEKRTVSPRSMFTRPSPGGTK